MKPRWRGFGGGVLLWPEAGSLRLHFALGLMSPLMGRWQQDTGAIVVSWRATESHERACSPARAVSPLASEGLASLVSGGRKCERIAFTCSGIFARPSDGHDGANHGLVSLSRAVTQRIARRGVGTSRSDFCSFLQLWLSFLFSQPPYIVSPCYRCLDFGAYFIRLLSVASGDVENYHSRPQVGVPLVERRGGSHFGHHDQGWGDATATWSSRPGEVGKVHTPDR